MNWNYRLVRMDVSYPKEEWHEIHEVFYTEKKKIRYWTHGPLQVSGQNPKSIIHDLLLMALDANRHPVLKESKMPGGKKKREAKK